MPHCYYINGHSIEKKKILLIGYNQHFHQTYIIKREMEIITKKLEGITNYILTGFVFVMTTCLIIVRKHY